MSYGFNPELPHVTERQCTLVWKWDCGSGGGEPLPDPENAVYWGNWQDPLPGGFNEDHFTDPPSGQWAMNSGGFNLASKTNRAGTYEFSVPPTPFNWWQVFWFPNTLLNPTGNPLTMTVQGFPFGLQPAPNTSYGSLTINGVAGKLFVTNGTNNGGFTTSGGNPVQVS